MLGGVTGRAIGLTLAPRASLLAEEAGDVVSPFVVAFQAGAGVVVFFDPVADFVALQAEDVVDADQTACAAVGAVPVFEVGPALADAASLFVRDEVVSLRACGAVAGVVAGQAAVDLAGQAGDVVRVVAARALAGPIHEDAVQAAVAFSAGVHVRTGQAARLGTGLANRVALHVATLTDAFAFGNDEVLGGVTDQALGRVGAAEAALDLAGDALRSEWVVGFNAVAGCAF